MRRSDRVDSAGNVAVTVLLALALVAAIAFGAWAFSGRQDYKNNVDKKIVTAVAAAKVVQKAQLQKDFDEQSKKPYKAFRGSVTYGTISFSYPKNWSAYVDEGSSSQPLNAYFYPDQVPGVQGNTAFALRVELVATPYSQAMQQYQSQISSGKLTASAYVPPKMVGVANVQPGTKMDGAISQGGQGAQNGTLVVIKVRDKTLKIYTQSTDFKSDFNQVILSSLTFVP